jgi:hypothetical protein
MRIDAVIFYQFSYFSIIVITYYASCGKLGENQKAVPEIIYCVSEVDASGMNFVLIWLRLGPHVA